MILLNLSVDTSDFHQEILGEDLSINDQESMIELILEQGFGLEDCIPEFDDVDNEEQGSDTGNSFKVIGFPSDRSGLDIKLFSEFPYPILDQKIFSSVIERTTPPPRI